MSKGIRVSPKHGVNPMLVVCPFCGKDTGAIALVGKLPGDAEAPRRGVIDWEPCKECATNFAQGVVFLEGVGEKPRPTGRYLVMSEEAFTAGCFKKGQRYVLRTEQFEGLLASIKPYEEESK